MYLICIKDLLQSTISMMCCFMFIELIETCLVIVEVVVIIIIINIIIIIIIVIIIY